MGRFKITRRVPRKVLKQQLAEANQLLGEIFQAEAAKRDPGNVIVRPTQQEVAQVTLGGGH